MRILVLSDLHCGHLLGLTPPSWWLDVTKPWAVPFWNHYVAAIKQIGKVDALVVNGDAIDGQGRKDSTAHLTTDIVEQVEMAELCLEAVRCKRRYFVGGTGYHTDNSGQHERTLAKHNGGAYHDELRLEIHGRRLHFRHVVGRSDIPYGQYNQLGKELINDLLQSHFEAYDPADVLIRSHVHYSVQVAIGDAATGRVKHAATTPALQLRAPVQSEYTRKLRTWLYHVGMLTIDIDKAGDVVILPRLIPIELYAPREYECLTE